jgi:hypothetical protein
MLAHVTDRDPDRLPPDQWVSVWAPVSRSVSSPVAQPLRVAWPGVRRRPLRRPSVRSLVQTYIRSIWPLAVTHAVIARHVGHDVESVAYAAWVLRGEGVIEVEDVVPSRTADGRSCRSQIRLRLTDEAMGIYKPLWQPDLFDLFRS